MINHSGACPPNPCQYKLNCNKETAKTIFLALVIIVTLAAALALTASLWESNINPLKVMVGVGSIVSGCVLYKAKVIQKESPTGANKKLHQIDEKRLERIFSSGQGNRHMFKMLNGTNKVHHLKFDPKIATVKDVCEKLIQEGSDNPIEFLWICAGRNLYIQNHRGDVTWKTVLEDAKRPINTSLIIHVVVNYLKN